MVETGASVRTKHALLTAGRNGLSHICLSLIDGGASLNKTNCFNHTVLMLAIRSGLEQVALTLIERGATLTTISKERLPGKTALDLACYYGLASVKLALLEKLSVGKITQSNFISAFSLGEDTVRELIIRGMDVNGVDDFGKTPLMRATDAGNLLITKLLLEKGARIRDKNRSGDTALTIAAEGGYEDICRLLLGGAEVDAQNEVGNTALMVAARNGFVEVCELLIGAGAEIDLQNKAGETALIIAAKRDNEEACIVLVESDADLNLKTDYIAGKAPLYFALENKNKNLFEFFLKKGADSRIGIGSSANALSYCLSYDLNDFYELLLLHTDLLATTSKIFRTKYKKKSVEAFMKTLCSILDKNKANADLLMKVHRNSGFILQLAVRYDLPEYITILLEEYKLDVDGPLEKEETVLHVAIRYKKIPLMTLLIEYGADPNAISSDRVSPLILSLGQKDHDSCIYLIRNGASSGAVVMGDDNLLVFASVEGLDELRTAILSNLQITVPASDLSRIIEQVKAVNRVFNAYKVPKDVQAMILLKLIEEEPVKALIYLAMYGVYVSAVTEAYIKDCLKQKSIAHLKEQAGPVAYGAWGRELEFELLKKNSNVLKKGIDRYINALKYRVKAHLRKSAHMLKLKELGAV